jgi:hypothetical protein
LKEFLLILILLVGGNLFAQDNDALPKNSMQVFFGPSQHGTDFVWGSALTVAYSHAIHKKLQVIGFLGSTMHHGKVDVDFWTSSGQIDAAKVDFTTGGMQGGLALGFSFYRSSRHHLQGSLGTLFRYQTTSNPEVLGLFTTYPYPNFLNFPARSSSFGGLAYISYDYTLKSGFLIGARAWLQYDSNDDALNIFSLVIGKRF